MERDTSVRALIRPGGERESGRGAAWLVAGTLHGKIGAEAWQNAGDGEEESG